MFGYSLSLCVRDIAKGKLDEREVEKIYANFPKNQFEVAMHDYPFSYWKGLPDAVTIARRLYQQGKIEFV